MTSLEEEIHNFMKSLKIAQDDDEKEGVWVSAAVWMKKMSYGMPKANCGNCVKRNKVVCPRWSPFQTEDDLCDKYSAKPCIEKYVHESTS